jgi:hypothetical protein
MTISREQIFDIRNDLRLLKSNIEYRYFYFSNIKKARPQKAETGFFAAPLCWLLSRFLRPSQTSVSYPLEWMIYIVVYY